MNLPIAELRRLMRAGTDGVKIGPFGSALRAEHITDCGFKVYGQENVIGGSFELGDRYVAPAKFTELRGYEIQSGDVLVTMMGTAGRCIAVPGDIERGIMDSHLLRLRPDADQLEPRYLVWLVNDSAHVRDQLESVGRGSIMHGLNSSIIKSVSIPLPPLPVQRAIANFLDRKTAAIDALIAKKERLIVLLEEKRQALITQAVTNGLDPSARMRDSGIEWMGSIPTHWEVHHLRRLVERFVDYRGRTPEKVAEGVPLITTGAFVDGRIDHSACPEYVTDNEYRFLLGRGRPATDDLLFTTEAPLGEVALVEDPRIALAQRIILFKINRERIRARFLWLHFRSAVGRSELVTSASGSTASGIRADRLKRTRVATPPLEEQDAIIAGVEQRDRQIIEAEAAIRRQLEHLREYRQALISAAVTGQLRVDAEAAA